MGRPFLASTEEVGAVIGAAKHRPGALVDVPPSCLSGHEARSFLYSALIVDRAVTLRKNSEVRLIACVGA